MREKIFDEMASAFPDFDRAAASLQFPPRFVRARPAAPAADERCCCVCIQTTPRCDADTVSYEIPAAFTKKLKEPGCAARARSYYGPGATRMWYGNRDFNATAGDTFDAMKFQLIVGRLYFPTDQESGTDPLLRCVLCEDATLVNSTCAREVNLKGAPVGSFENRCSGSALKN